MNADEFKDQVDTWVLAHEHEDGIALYGFRAVGFEPGHADEEVLLKLLGVDFDPGNNETLKYERLTNDLKSIPVLLFLPDRQMTHG